jgi:succinoglycan biosynthesis protein ExoA
MTSATPVLSVIVATLDEEHHIEALLRSLADQDLDEPYEVLIIDGGSSDRTRELVLAHPLAGERVRLLDNPHRSTPYAFNIGIEHARGVFVAILGAHSRYEPNYLSACLRVVAGADRPIGCGGLVRTVPAGPDRGARLAAGVMSSSFASSSRSFRTQGAGEVESIPFPVYRRSDLLDVGGFDERLDRNQDNDLSERLRANGVRMVITGETSCDYVARRNLPELLRYAARTGRWNGRTVRMGLRVLQPRHLLPGAFAAGVGASALVGLTGRHVLARTARRGLAAVLVAHLAAGTRSAFRDTHAAGSDDRDHLTPAEQLALPPAVLAFHLAYGGGVLRGLTAAPRDSS